jgi:hypothetical protein
MKYQSSIKNKWWEWLIGIIMILFFVSLIPFIIFIISKFIGLFFTF